MKQYLRLLPFIKGLWPLVFLGFIFSLIYALTGGLSLPAVYPILGKIFNTQPTAEQLSPNPIWTDFGRFVATIGGQALDTVFGKSDFKQLETALGAGIIDIMKGHHRHTVIGFFCVVGALRFFIKYLAGISQRYCYIIVEENLMVRLYRRMFGH